MRRMRKRSKKSDVKDIRIKSSEMKKMNKTQILKNVIPVLASSDTYDIDYLVEPYTNVLKLRTLYVLYDEKKQVPLKVSDLNKYKLTFNEIKERAFENIRFQKVNVVLKHSRYPHNEKIFAIMGSCATTALFSRWPSAFLSMGKVLVVPIYDDFVVFTPLGTEEELIEFYRIASSMIYAAGEKGTLLCKELFIFEPATGKMERLDTEKYYGQGFDLVAINGNSDVERQITKYSELFATKILSAMMGMENAVASAISQTPEFTNLKDKIRGDLSTELLKKRFDHDRRSN
jgi:hypothetical protein